jgi:predicted Fe-S protein YdhL (DUF1289 family)
MGLPEEKKDKYRERFLRWKNMDQEQKDVIQERMRRRPHKIRGHHENRAFKERGASRMNENGR